MGEKNMYMQIQVLQILKINYNLKKIKKLSQWLKKLRKLI